MDTRVPKDDVLDLSTAIEELAQDVVLLEPTGLPRLGALLNRVNSIHNRINAVDLAGMAALTRGLKTLIEKLIMGEVPDRTLAVDAIGRGVSLLQALRENNEQWAEEVDVWGALLAPLGVLFESAERNEEEFPGSAPSEAAPERGYDRGLYRDFVAEALEHLGSIEIHLINLEQKPRDRDGINSIFRPFHNIKGVAGFLNLTQISRFAHEIETLLDGVRNDQLRVAPELIDFVLSAVDQMKAMILDLRNSLETGAPLTQWDLEHHLEEIRRVQKRLSADISQEPRPIGQILVENGNATADDVEAALEKQKDQSENRRLGEILIAKNKVEPKHIVQALRHQRTQIPTLDTARGTHEALKVDMEKLDTLMDMVGELVNLQSIIRRNRHVTAIRDQKLFKDLTHFSRLASELQKAVMSLRMIPIGEAFQRMVRLVRDLSREAGKRVDLQIEGGDTETDRNIVETLYDPLVHMIRNAVDHGIETPEVRRGMGKPESGCIRLNAHQRSGDIVIEITDDGRGLDRDRILSRAIEKGLVDAENTLTEREIDNLIFHPGLSTSDKVTLVSGRGVGMDVVKKAVEGLRGKVEVESKRGKGSVFTIRLPLTLANIDSLVVR